MLGWLRFRLIAACSLSAGSIVLPCSALHSQTSLARQTFAVADTAPATQLTVSPRGVFPTSNDAWAAWRARTDTVRREPRILRAVLGAAVGVAIGWYW
jgi:hypothetical protein